MKKWVEITRLSGYAIALRGRVSGLFCLVRGYAPSLVSEALGIASQVLAPGHTRAKEEVGSSPSKFKIAPSVIPSSRFFGEEREGSAEGKDVGARGSVPSLVSEALRIALQVLAPGHTRAQKHPASSFSEAVTVSPEFKIHLSEPTVLPRSSSYEVQVERRSIWQAAVRVAGPACAGVALMQFVIVFPLLVIFIFGIVDFARFYTLQSVLNKGAEDGARAAATMSNLDTDLRGLTTSDDAYLQYNEARRRVLEAAQVYPLQTLVSDIDTPSPSKLVPFYMTDSMLSLGMGQQAPVIRAGAALVRPGERVEYGELPPYSTLDNQLYPPGPGGALPPQNMSMLMKEYPVEVHLRATLDLIIPLGQVTVVGSSIGWHGRVPRGPFGNILGSTTSTTTTSTTSTTQTSTTTTSTTTTTVCVMNWNSAIATTTGGGTLGRCPVVSGPPDSLGYCPNNSNGCSMDGL